MNNQKIAKIFYQIAKYLEIDRIPFKPYAYQRAALGLEGLEEDVREIYNRGGLKELEQIPGVGKNIALKIEEYIKTGKIETYGRLKKKNPFNLGELTAVEGLGVRKSKILYQKLKIKNLKDLEKAAKAHQIAALEGFGEKTEKNILQGIEFLKRSKGRFLLGEIAPVVEEVLEKLKSLKEVKKISVAGSVRRMKETIGDVDILAVSKEPKKVMAFFCSLAGTEKIWSQGPTKSSVRTKDGFDMDLRVVPAKSYGSALQYFTGSKEHNIAVRRMAISQNLKLNEYGLFRGSKMVAGKTEEGIYEALGLKAMAPELRENNGEIEAAFRSAQGKLPGLPDIIDYYDLKGDLHCHSNWDGGADSIEKIAEAAQALGYKYIGIADHTKFLRIERGLDENRLLEQRKEINKLNAEIQMPNIKSNPKSKFQILQGCEANILNDGSIDIKDEVLAKLDFVIAGIHSNMKMDKNKMTERIIKAMKNPNVDIISHPTGRILKRRDEYQADFDKILRAAKETNTILEINSSPDRLDLKDVNIRKAKDLGVRMIINTDAHQIDQLGLIKYGIAQARRGWAEKKDIINTQPLKKLLRYFN